MENNISLHSAVAEFLLDCKSRQLSPHTISDYSIALRRLQQHLGAERDLHTITTGDLRRFFAWLGREEFPQPGAAERPASRLGKKTVLNHHTAVSAFYTWAQAQRLVEEHLMRQIRRPKKPKRAIIPLTEEEINALLAVVERSESFIHPRSGEKTFYQRHLAARDRCIILLLVDTGMRISELCHLRLDEIDLRNSRVLVRGKGDKTRWVPLSPTTRRAVRRYMTRHRPPVDFAELLVGQQGDPFNRNAAGRLLKRLGERAGVSNVTPHRFRHTFAIMFLRGGGNVYALREILGHSTLQMAQAYLHIVESDVESAHRSASPVTQMNLT